MTAQFTERSERKLYAGIDPAEHTKITKSPKGNEENFGIFCEAGLFCIAV
jgi:hypothetical protein